MSAKQAVDWVDSVRWTETPAAERLALLKQIQDNIEIHWREMAKADCRMKGLSLDDKANAHQVGTAMQATVVPLASNVAECINVYEELVKGRMPEPVEIKKVDDTRYDLRVFPIQARDKIMYMDRKDYLRVKGEPKQANPLDKEGGIIAVLGAGNYGSAFELIRALFIENCVVVHKAHHLNAGSDRVWEKALKPLVDHRALSFCDPDAGRELTADDRLKKIYFTGGTATAKAIQANASAELVSECGGNNPCIIVPGDRPWTKKEIEHHAIQLATFGKMNGGCRMRTRPNLVTCKNWPQRREFLDALAVAIRDDTPGATTYYPGTDQTFARFHDAYPDAKLIQPESGAITNSDFLLIEDIEADGFAAQHEAFCQVLTEAALDTSPEIETFLPKAVEFANTRLLGTLGACVLIEDDTMKNHQAVVDQAVTDLQYGGIAINTMPPFVFMNPYLTWGGNEEGRELVSGSGNFGNLMSVENIEKSIVTCSFISPGHMLLTNKAVFRELCEEATQYAIRPSWKGCPRR